MMLRFVVVNANPHRMERMMQFLPAANTEVFKATTGPDPKKAYPEYIPLTYQRLALQALKKKWGLETIVLQDDVWMPHGPGFEVMHQGYDSELIVYGRTDSTGLICPLSFAASPQIWKLLAKAWDGKKRICTAWQPIVKKHGLVLDMVKPMGGEPSVVV